MKNFRSLSLVTLCLLLLCGSCQSKPETPSPDRIVLAYVTSWKTGMPDPFVVTHINYAFGHVTDNFGGVRIDNEERLKEIVSLKQQNPDLKVFLSIGGWGSGNFSEMAADKDNRLSFSKDCKRVIDEFNLDGIDMDWEYPTMDLAGISASPEDTDNFTLLMQDIRNAIGKDKLLTLASEAGANFIDFRAIEPVVDFVNIMTYDINHPPYHHAALYPSSMTQYGSCAESLESHIEAGFPVEKLVLGVPFYGRGTSPLSDFVNYRNLIELEGFSSEWDDIACVPYLTDSLGNMICGYEDPRSIALKCEFVKEKGMLGIMYWEYHGDDDEGTLRHAVYNGMKK